MTLSCLLLIMSITNSLAYGYQTPQIVYFTQSLNFSGSTDFNCTSCSSGLIKVLEYQVLDQTTPALVYQFNSVLEPGYLLRSIQANLTGSFLTRFQYPYYSVISIFVGITVIQSNFPLPQSAVTSCYNCQTVLSIQGLPLPVPWWPGFNYTGTNEFSLSIEKNGISISSAQLIFETVYVVPQLISITPNLIPSDGLSHKITFNLENIFPESFRYYCIITIGSSKYKVDAVPIGNNMTCLLQPTHDQTDGQILILPNLDDWGNMEWPPDALKTKTIKFYNPPLIESISPTSGPETGNTEVTISGFNFFNSEYLSCRFGTIVVPANYISNQQISCTTPSTNAGLVNVEVSENGDTFSYSPGIVFSFKDNWTPINPSPNKPSSNNYLIIGVSTGMGALAVLAIGFLTYQKCKKSGDYDEIPDLDLNIVIKRKEIDFKEKIGRGSFGDVYRGFWRYTEVAIKMIHDPTDEVITELYNEAKLMTQLRHPNIVNIMGVITSKPEVCIVTEYVTRGSLYNIIHDKNVVLHLEHVRRLALDTCQGMAYLHESRVIHRDLKSHNLLVDKSWTIKVADFGLSRVLEETFHYNSATMTACGTPCWTAPEVLRNQRYTIKADVYSFAICLWELLARIDPYIGIPAYQVVLNVATKGLRPAIPKDCLPDFVDLITVCWNEDPDKRPTFGMLVGVLQEMKGKLPKSPRYPIVIDQTRIVITGKEKKEKKQKNSKMKSLIN